MRKSVVKNKYVTRTVKTGTCVKYEILVQSLNSELQNCINIEKYRFNNEKSKEPSLRKADCEQMLKGGGVEPSTGIPFNASNQEGVILPHTKQIGLARYDLVNLWIDCKKNSTNKIEAGKEFLTAYNSENIYPVLFNILGKISIGTIYCWSKNLKNTDNYTNLIPHYDYGEKEYCPKLTHEEELVFKNLLLAPIKTNIAKARKLTKFILNKCRILSPTSERNFRRFADNYKKKHYDKWILAREGQLLVEIDSRDYQNKVKEIEGTLKEALANKKVPSGDTEESQAELSQTNKNLDFATKD